MFIRILAILFCFGVGHCQSTATGSFSAILLNRVCFVAAAAILDSNSCVEDPALTGDVQCLFQQGWSVNIVSSVDAAGAAGTLKAEAAAKPDVSDYGTLLQVQQTVVRPRVHERSHSNVSDVTATFDVPVTHSNARNATAAITEDVTAFAAVVAEISTPEVSANLTVSVAPHADVAVPEISETFFRLKVGEFGSANASVFTDGRRASALLPSSASIKGHPRPPTPLVEAPLPAEPETEPTAPDSLPVLPSTKLDAFGNVILSILWSHSLTPLINSKAIGVLLLFAAYPAFLFSVVCGAAALGVCLVQDKQISHGCGGPPRVPPSRLAPVSRRSYNVWSFFCAFFPAQVVIGTPLIFVMLRWHWPEETLVALLASAVVWMCLNVAALIVSCGLSFMRIHRCIEEPLPDSSHGMSKEESEQVTHWVLLPNYQEDLSKLTATVESVCRSAVVGTHVGLVLAMDEREAATIFGKAKAQQVCDRYASKFREFHLCLRPMSVQSASLEKASNVSWGFDWLLEHLACTNQDTSRALLTVISPGDELHELYFQRLAEAYLTESTQMRALMFWQSPVLSLKGYHQQLAPVAVGSALDAIFSLTSAQPMSSYSLSLSLARRVGGWDSEAVAEDAHMGAKCFLLTLGVARVRPLPLPTLRAAPSSFSALWVERQRHALGSGNVVAYYLETLPLVLAHIISAPNGISLSDFIRVWFGSFSHLGRFTNNHVLPGTLAAIALVELVRCHACLRRQQQVAAVGSGQLLAGLCLAGLLAFVAACASACLTMIYGRLRKRLWEVERRAGANERKERNWDGLHSFAVTRWLCCCFRMVVFGACYCVILGAGAWAAAAETVAGRAWEEKSPRTNQRPSISPAAEVGSASKELSDATPPR